MAATSFECHKGVTYRESQMHLNPRLMDRDQSLYNSKIKQEMHPKQYYLDRLQFFFLPHQKLSSLSPHPEPHKAHYLNKLHRTVTYITVKTAFSTLKKIVQILVIFISSKEFHLFL